MLSNLIKTNKLGAGVMVSDRTKIRRQFVDIKIGAGNRFKLVQLGISKVARVLPVVYESQWDFQDDASWYHSWRGWLELNRRSNWYELFQHATEGPGRPKIHLFHSFQMVRTLKQTAASVTRIAHSLFSRGRGPTTFSCYQPVMESTTFHPLCMKKKSVKVLHAAAGKLLFWNGGYHAKTSDFAQFIMLWFLILLTAQ